MKKVTLIIFVAIIVTIIFSLLTFPIYAGNGNLRLTAEMACEIAIRNSRQLALDDLEIGRLEKAYERAKEEARLLPDAFGKSSVLSNKINREIKPFNAQTDLEVARKTREDNIKNLEINVRKAMLDILFARMNLENEKARLDMEQYKYDNLLIRYMNGEVSEHDKTAAEYEFFSKKLGYEQYEQSLENFKMRLKNLLGYSFDEDCPEVIGEIKYVPYGDLAVDVIVESAISRDTDIYRKQRTLEARRRTFEITAGYYEEGEAYYDDALFELIMAEADLEDALTRLEVTIKNMYNRLLNLKDDVTVARAEEALSRKVLEGVKERHEKGLVSKMVLMEAEQQYGDDAFAVLRAEYEYMSLKTEFSKWTD
jgi:outer membrane protein TolC